MGTYFVAVLVILLIISVIRRMVIRKKKGKSPFCNCGCESCSAQCAYRK